MAEERIDLAVKVEPWTRGDGLVFGVRVSMENAPAKLALSQWYWLNRETDTLEELRAYRVGMQLGEKRR